MYLAGNRPTHPLHYTLALEIQKDAMNLHRQAYPGLGLESLYLALQVGCFPVLHQLAWPRPIAQQLRSYIKMTIK